MKKPPTLIVEDTPNYQQIYSRAVERQGGEPVVVDSLETAVAAIQQRLFPAAIVDIRLDEADETNEDGLKVLQYLRKSGDETNAIVITGHGTMKIGWEARLHSAYAKAEKGPDEDLDNIEKTIASAHSDFRKRSRGKINYPAALKTPKDEVWQWEDMALRSCAPTGGAEGLNHFLDDFLREFFPLARHSKISGCRFDLKKKIAAGLFWSRSIGGAIVVAFGQKSEVDLSPAKIRQLMELNEIALGAPLKKVDAFGISGTISPVETMDFSGFVSNNLR